MLNIVGKPIIMGNAPEEIKNIFSNITLDNNHDGTEESNSNSKNPYLTV